MSGAMATPVVRKLFDSPSRAQQPEHASEAAFAVPQPSPAPPPLNLHPQLTPSPAPPSYTPATAAPSSAPSVPKASASPSTSQRSYGRIFRAPLDDDDDDDHQAAASNGIVATVSYRVPADEDSDDDEVSSSRPYSGPVAVHIQPGRELLAAQQHSQQELQLASEASSRLKDRLRQIDRLLAEELERVELSMQEKQAQMALADEDSLRWQGQQREQKRKQLQQQHQQTAQQHKASVERIEAEQRRQLEAVRAAEEAKRQAQLEEQRRKHAEEEAKRQAELQEQQRKQQEEAQARAQQQQQQQQQQAAAARPAGTSGAPVASVPVSGPMAVSQMAKDWAEVYERKLKEAEQATSDFASSAASKTDRRKLEKEITKFVQQISGTQRQVAAKVADLTRLLSSVPAPAAQLYACIVLANKLLSQCDAQITKLQSFAFPLAVVAVRVGVAHPQFMDILVAKLHRVCTFTVPQYPRKQQGQAAEEYAKALGYKQVEAGNDGSMRLESSDEFSSRLQAYVLLYAAITQVEEPNNPHGLQHAWAYVARVINYMPITRNSAAALQAFLRVAGYCMAKVYRQQFMKLLQALQDSFISQLATSTDPDTKPSLARLQTYIGKQQWRTEPEGRKLPADDESSQVL